MDHARTTRVLLAAAFITFFDRALLPPLIPVVADDLGASLGDVGNALTVYLFAYAVTQLGWAVISERIGRIRTLMIAIPIGAIGVAITALAPDPITLLVGRALAGAGFAATVPATLTYFGDTLSWKQRSAALANLAGALALGLTAGTLAASAAGEWAHWRVPFVVLVVVAIIVALAHRRIPDPITREPLGLFRGVAVLIRNGWVVLILGLTVIEGALVVGAFSYLPVALQATGESVVVAGLATALFGVAVIVGSQLVKFLIARCKPWMILAAGASATVVAYTVVAVTISIPTVAVAAVLLGFAWAASHTQIQAWMTDAAVEARPVGMALFAVALFMGAAGGAAAGAGAASEQLFAVLFWSSAAVGLVLLLGSAIGRARYTLREGDPV